jgi:competence protein ComEC
VVTPLVFIVLTASLYVDVHWGLWLLDQAYFIAWWSLEKINQLPATLWWPNRSLTLLDIAMAAIGSLLLLLPRALGFGFLGALLLLISLLLPRTKPFAARLDVLDVGQGLAVLIQTPKQAILFDTGASFSPRFNAGTHLLTPYLISQGIHNVNIVISRDNAEHAGGLRGLKLFSWQTIISGEPLAEYPQARFCTTSMQGNWDLIHWQVIAPVAAAEDFSRSCALKLVIGDKSIYLFGDISPTQQRALLNDESMANAYILLAPGQGAKNQHLPQLAQRLKPTYTVFSNATRNRYAHPHPKVVADYRQQGSQVLLTAQLGAMRWQWDSATASPTLTTQWPKRQTYWYPHHNGGNLPQPPPSE